MPYKTTSLEKNYKWELLTEPDLGVKIDLIDPDTYATDVRQLSGLVPPPPSRLSLALIPALPISRGPSGPRGEGAAGG